MYMYMYMYTGNLYMYCMCMRMYVYMRGASDICFYICRSPHFSILLWVRIETPALCGLCYTCGLSGSKFP